MQRLQDVHYRDSDNAAAILRYKCLSQGTAAQRMELFLYLLWFS